MRYSVVPFLKDYGTYGDVPEDNQIGAFVVDLCTRRDTYEREAGGAVIDDDRHHLKVCECESVALASMVCVALNTYNDNK